jgi:hypothetical protein
LRTGRCGIGVARRHPERAGGGTDGNRPKPQEADMAVWSRRDRRGLLNAESATVEPKPEMKRKEYGRGMRRLHGEPFSPGFPAAHDPSRLH